MPNSAQPLCGGGTIWHSRWFFRQACARRGRPFPRKRRWRSHRGGVWLAGLACDGGLGVRPIPEAIRSSADWSLRLFWLTLLISPARRVLSAPRLIRARRILGLGTFGLTALHVGLYAFDQEFDWGRIGLEIVLRVYLAIGAVATVALAALAATSTDGAIARLGSRGWNRLHRFVYAVAVLSAVHFLL